MKRVELERLIWKSLILYFYLFLVIALVVAMIFLKLDKLAKVQLVFLGALGYMLTAFLYHYLDKTLTAKIIIEYVLLALVAVMVISTLI